MHSPIPINEAEARRSLYAGIDKAVTRSHIKWFVEVDDLSAAHEQHKQQIDDASSRLDRVAAMLGVL